MTQYYVDKTRSVFIEAEAGKQLGSNWATTGADGYASGNLAMMALNGSVDPAKLSEQSRLDYSVNFGRSGTYYIHLRGKATGLLESSNSVYVGLDGKLLPNSGGFDKFDLGYHWNTSQQTNDHVIKVNVPQGGHTINFWTREQGFTIDALYVTSDPGVRPGDQQAAAASDFIKSVGINIHAGFGWTSYNNLQTVVDSLKYLGITHLRDTLVYDGNWLNKIDELGALGYDFSFFINNNEYSPLEWQLEQIAKRVHMTSVIEGPNETDLWPVTYGTLSGMEATRALMRDLYFKVNDESTLLGQSLKDVSVIQTSFAFPNSMVAAGDLSSFADYGNTHTYFSWGATPGSGIDSRIRDAQLVSRSDAMMTTEAGYHTAINSNQSDTNVGITEAVQAKYIARLLMEQYARGVERTYLYELLDQNADPALSNKELNFGLFQEDGTPKLAAHAVHNLMTTLKDDGQSFKPGYLGYHWKGMPGTADDLLFQKSDGRFILVVWNDVDIWDESARREIELTDAQVTLRFDKAAKSVKVYDALRSAEIPTATFYDKSSISLAIPEHPILIEILPSDFVL